MVSRFNVENALFLYEQIPENGKQTGENGKQTKMENRLADNDEIVKLGLVGTSSRLNIYS